MADDSPVNWKKLLVLAGVVFAAGLVYYLFRDELTLSALARHEERLRSFGTEHPAVVVAASFAIYVIVTGLSLPLATGMTLALGWLFKVLFGEWAGLATAVLTVSFASAAGSTLAFLMSRYVFRDAVQSRFGERLRTFNRALEKEGGFYLFTLRLIPAVPFFVINVVMGLTPMRVWTFWWVSQLGMLPGTCVYVYAGAQVPTLSNLADEGVKGVLQPQVIAAFVILGLFPLAVKKLIGRLRPQAKELAEQTDGTRDEGSGMGDEG